MSQTNSSHHSKFKTRKEFMEVLGDMLISRIDSTPEDYGEARGRPRLLKTYLMEANSKLPTSINLGRIRVFKEETQLRDVSVLNLVGNRKAVKFYLDTSDERFWMLHTDAEANDAKKFFDKLVHSPESKLDKVWFPIEMMNDIVKIRGNKFRGFGLKYVDFFSKKDEDLPVAELKMRVHGSSSIDALDALRNLQKLKQSISYSMMSVKRGNYHEYVIQELTYSGRFVGRGGNSIDDYISLIEMSQKMYRNLIEDIERNSLGVKKVEGRTLIEGKAFDFILDREITNTLAFVEQLLSSSKPFRLWGLKNKISKDYYQIVCVDLHTGDNLNIEVSPNLIRVYLPKGACGNTILRLFSNLQHYYDSAIKLNDEKLQINHN